jgi:hypothetical protein
MIDKDSQILYSKEKMVLEMNRKLEIDKNDVDSDTLKKQILSLQMKKCSKIDFKSI